MVATLVFGGLCLLLIIVNSKLYSHYKKVCQQHNKFVERFREEGATGPSLEFATNEQLLKELLHRTSFEGVIVIKMPPKFENSHGPRNHAIYKIDWSRIWGFQDVAQASQALQRNLSLYH